MVTLALAALSLSACHELENPPELTQADQSCKSYVAVPGEPCRDGLYLDVPIRYRGTPIATCQCYLVPVKRKK